LTGVGQYRLEFGEEVLHRSYLVSCI
jgi:hypothetical protein